MLDWTVTVEELPWEEYLAALESGEFDLYFGEVRLTANWDLSDLVGTGGAMNYGGVIDGPALLYLSRPPRPAPHPSPATSTWYKETASTPPYQKISAQESTTTYWPTPPTNAFLPNTAPPTAGGERWENWATPSTP